jgi:hypothetical protein
MAYIGVSPSNGVRQKHTYTATASQTTFSGAGSEGVSLSYRDSNYVDVYRNGVKLGDADYTATSGTSVVLGEGAAVSDIIEIVTYDVFSVADTVSKADGGTFDGNVSFADNTKAIFGDGDDLQIYHDGSNSFIKDSGTGNLTIQAEDFAVQSSDASATHIFVDSSSGYTSLSYGGSTKLNTTNTGIDVTGVITTDGMTTSADINFGDNDKAVFGAGSDLQIYHDGSNSYVKDAGTGSIVLEGQDLYLNSTVGTYLRGVQSGAVTIFHNDSAKLTTTSTGIDVTGNVDISSGQLDLDANYRVRWGASNNYSIMSDNANYIQFHTAGSERMRIDSSGNLLVGTTDVNPYDNSSGAGIALRSTGAIYNAIDGGTALILNRMTSTGNIAQFRKDGTTAGSIGVSSSGTDLYIGNDDVGLRFSNGGNAVTPYNVTTQADSDNVIDLGYSSGRFDDIYATNGTIQTSDQQEKNTITDSDLGIDFIKRLTPKSYIFNGKTRTHYGLIAQDVETVLSDISKPTSGFAGFIKSDISEAEDGSEYRYGLRYGEFVAPLIQAVKDQQAIIEDLQARIIALENAE